MPSTPATRGKTKPKEPTYDDIVVLSRDDEAQTFTAKIFDGETFVFSTDINGYLHMAAFSGRTDSFIEFMDSLVEVPLEDDDDDKDIERKTREEGKRFHDLLAGQKGLTIERLAKFVADITEIAGDRPTNSSAA